MGDPAECAVDVLLRDKDAGELLEGVVELASRFHIGQGSPPPGRGRGQVSLGHETILPCFRLEWSGAGAPFSAQLDVALSPRSTPFLHQLQHLGYRVPVPSRRRGSETSLEVIGGQLGPA